MAKSIFFVHNGEPLAVPPVSLQELRLDERRHLEKWVETRTEMIGEPLLMIAREFDRFDKSDKRLDLLAMDQSGKLAIIELKRDIAGSLADLQALRYAAFCSQMTFDEVVGWRAKHAGVSEDHARQEIREFVGDAS